jgi:glyoxylase-like metal-dependent hydrolase (beta-lactamase superfamily II)
MSTPDPSHSASEHAGAGGAGEDSAQAELLAREDVLLVRAGNPSPLTLSGTNTWVLGRAGAWVVDPGPLLEEHLGRLHAAIEERGGLAGVVLTHDHHDHSEAVRTLLDDYHAPLAAGRGEVDHLLVDGERIGPFEALATPGHAPDHFSLIAGGVCFTGDAVLGNGSVFISPSPGAMAGYLRGLRSLAMRDDIKVLCPGHGPAVWDARAKIEEYIGHRVDREKRLIAALGEGWRSTQELLDAVWSEVPENLRPLASVTLAAHLDKLEEDDLLPAGVERPSFERAEW